MAKTAQDFVPIQEIHEGIVVLKDGQLCLVLMTSAVNFDLKSGDEQEAITLQYQNFLNSLDFSIQIFIQSRKLDIRPYVMRLEDRIKEETNELIRIQIHEYVQFIKSFTESTNIMTKSFFVVIPYSPGISFGGGKGTGARGILSGIFGKKEENATFDRERFEEHRSQLEQRRDVVVQGLSRFGVRASQLDTEALVELFFKMFNPGELGGPAMQDIDGARTTKQTERINT